MWCTLGTKWDEFPGTLNLPQSAGVIPDGEITLLAHKDKPTLTSPSSWILFSIYSHVDRSVIE